MTNLYNRAVLPDEIDTDPVEAPSFAQTAYLAYQQAFREFEELTGTVDFLDTVARVKAALQRVAELETELKQSRAATDRVASDLQNSLATVTRERDELAGERDRQMLRAAKAENRHESCAQQVDSLTRELVEAKALANKRGDMVCDYERLLREEKLETHALSGKLAEAKRQQDHVSKVSDARLRCLDRHIAELAEAREELRLLVPIADAARDVCAEAVWARGRSLVAAYDAHRAKTSGAAGDGTCTPVESAAPELPYETAPRLTKGDEVRLLKAGVHVGSDFVVRVSPHDGQRVLLRESGWRNVRDVVRVEPEKAECAQCGGSGWVEGFSAQGCKYRCSVCNNPFPHDGGGERSGQVGAGRSVHWDDAVSRFSKLAELPADDGPPRVGDVVRIEELYEPDLMSKRYAVGSKHIFAGVSGDINAKSRWELSTPGVVSSSYVSARLSVLRRAGQPEANTVLPIDTEDERVVDALVHRKTADRAETPLLGPHSRTAQRVDRIERWLASREPEVCEEIEEEIRAERAGRVKP